MTKLEKTINEFCKHFDLELEKTFKEHKCFKRTQYRIIGEKSVIQIETDVFPVVRPKNPKEKSTLTYIWIIERDENSPDGEMIFVGREKSSRHYRMKNLKAAFKHFAKQNGYSVFIM